MSVCANEDVLGLEISVDNASSMETFYTFDLVDTSDQKNRMSTTCLSAKPPEKKKAYDLSSIEPCPITSESTPSCELRSQITTRMEVHDEEKILLVMETPPELDDEGILRFAGHTLQDSLFCESVLEFLVR